MFGCASTDVAGIFAERMFINMVFVYVVQMTIVKVIQVISVLYRFVSARLSVLMGVLFMSGAVHFRLLENRDSDRVNVYHGSETFGINFASCFLKMVSGALSSGASRKVS